MSQPINPFISANHLLQLIKTQVLNSLSEFFIHTLPQFSPEVPVAYTNLTAPQHPFSALAQLLSGASSADAPEAFKLV